MLCGLVSREHGRHGIAIRPGILGDNLSVALNFGFKVKVLLSQLCVLLVFEKELLPKLDDFVARDGNFIFHVSYE